MIDYINKLNDEQVKNNSDSFLTGDTVEVHQKIVEGNRERIQVFKGIVIAKKHEKNQETFIVRKVSKGVGIEKIFPLHSPSIDKIVVVRRGKTRRAKLYYLRDRIGKSSVIKEKR